MATLLIAEHDNASIKDSTNKALTAATALGGEVDVLVAGENAKAAAEPRPSSPASARCCWRTMPPMRMILPSRWPR